MELIEEPAQAPVKNPPPPILIALPGGLYVSGVVTWAVGLANAAVEAGGRAGLLIHAQRAGYSRAHPRIDPRIACHDLAHLGDFEQGTLDLQACLAAYSAAAMELNAGCGGPVMVLPNLHGDCYGVVAAMTHASGMDVRAIGWCHLDSAYDVGVIRHYAPSLNRCVAVSNELHHRLAMAPGGEGGPQIELIPYGVRALEAACRPRYDRIELVYSGRLEKQVKRAHLLPRLSELLEARGICHRLTLIGDGPARTDIETQVAILETTRRARASANRFSIRAMGPLSVTQRDSLLAQTHLFVLPSTSEGLSLSMLEAMRAGCVPIVTAVASGAGQLIAHGKNGYLVNASGPEDKLIEAVADAAASFASQPSAQRDLLSVAASAAAEPYSIERHVQRVFTMFARVANEPKRSWPKDRPWEFAEGGNVSKAGEQRFAALLTQLVQSGERIAVYGTGAHSRSLAHLLEANLSSIVCFIDDAPGSVEWLSKPVLSPHRAVSQRPTAIIISSRLHAAEMEERCRRVLPQLPCFLLYAAERATA